MAQRIRRRYNVLIAFDKEGSLSQSLQTEINTEPFFAFSKGKQNKLDIARGLDKDHAASIAATRAQLSGNKDQEKRTTDSHHTPKSIARSRFWKRCRRQKEASLVYASH